MRINADLNLLPLDLPPRMIHHDHDAPAWWLMHKKQRLYSDGFAQKGPRALMQFNFEVDVTDRSARSGWSVVVQGVAQELTRYDRVDVIDRLADLRIEPWAPGDKPHVVRIVPLQITGRRVRPGA